MKKQNKNFVYDKSLPKLLRLVIRILMPFWDIYWSCLLFIARITKVQKNKKKYYFSICAIFKDEGLSLKEWIEYHSLIGVDHFYLYNNFSSDNYGEILKPYIQNGTVDLIDWKVPPPSQASAYKHCNENYWSESEWIAFIDLDEFFCPKYETSIKDWVKKFERFPSVIVYWKMFGTSALIDHDYNRLITEQYTSSWDRYYDIGKSIFNTRFQVYDFSPRFVHEIASYIEIFGIRLLIPPINEFKKFVKFKCNRIGLFNNLNDFTIQLNHYFSKSYGEFIISKKRRGAPSSIGERAKNIRSLNAFNWNQSHCTSVDFNIQRFIIGLKVRMGKAKHIQKLIDEN